MTVTTHAIPTDTSRNTLMRPDTFFGVCEAIGQDFGFNPLWLRLAFVPPVFFQPAYALAAYLALGLVVLASRLLFPDKSVQSNSAATPAVAMTARSEAASESPAPAFEERLPLAA
jgi:phage shock protein C